MRVTLQCDLAEQVLLDDFDSLHPYRFQYCQEQGDHGAPGGLLFEDPQNEYRLIFLYLQEFLVQVAEVDALRAEGEAYGRRLEQAVPGSLTHRVAGAIHGFFGRFDGSGRSAAAMALIARRLAQ